LFMIKIAVSGKGGVGKTTISGTLARLLAREGYDVLAIDADPSMNLASSIGVRDPPKPLTELKDLIEDSELRTQIGKNARKTIEKRFTWDKISRKFEKIYELAIS